MERPDRRVKAIFDQALEIDSAPEQAAFLDGECAASPELRLQVEALLQAYADAGSFLEGPAPTNPAATEDSRPGQADEAPPGPAERPGSRIGPYKLLQEIGTGGMGTVWMAEQQEPVRRMVALKVIKAGMDSKQVVARFEAERQALALMDHPNIARVLDAGTTPEGRPFFVMDLVKGVPITEYGDEHRLTPRQRLELFVPVCQALQHAHQKGIIHRDVKPTNVLVAPYDGKPVIKVIDFGVAKATGGRLTEKTMFTEFGAVVGTPEYMSPEQAELNNQDIDTRSDVYSLGVLLYELLTGSTPLTKQSLKGSSILDLLKRIREEEPPRPSTRLSKSKESLPTISAQRQTDPAQLTRQLRGELDWIVMKALDKDRTRRYETANGLARDVERYLRDETVEACPPSASYRLRKFARKNRRLLVTAVAFAALLLLAAVVSAWLAVRATFAEEAALTARDDEAAQREQAERQRDRAVWAEALAEKRLAQVTAEKRRADDERAVAQAVNDFLLKDLLGQADIANQPFGDDQPERNKDVTVRKLLDRAARAIEGKFAQQSLTEAAIRQTLGDIYRGMTEYGLARPHAERAVALRSAHLGAQHPDTLTSKGSLAHLNRSEGKYEQAERLYLEVLQACATRLGVNHPETLKAKNNLALLYRNQKKYEQARSLLEEVAEGWTARLGPDHPRTLTGKLNLALVYSNLKQDQQAEELYKEVIQKRLTLLGADHPDTLMAKHNLAILYRNQRKYEQAEPLFAEVLQVRTRILGPEHRETLASRYDLGVLYLARRKYSQAEPLLREAADGIRTKLGMAHGLTQLYLRVLLACYEENGKHSDAEPLRRELAEFWKRQAGADSTQYASALLELGRNLRQQRKSAEAESLLRECVTIRQRKEPDVWTTFHTQSLMGGVLLDQKKYAEAEPLLLAGYEGMKQREAKIPANGKARLTDALQRLVRLYTAWGRQGETDAWRKKLTEAEVAAKRPATP